MANEVSFPVPDVVSRSIKNLLKPGEDFDSIYQNLDYILDPYCKRSLWSKEQVAAVVRSSGVNTLHRYFPKICEPTSWKLKNISKDDNTSEDDCTSKLIRSSRKRGPYKSKKKTSKHYDSDSSSKESQHVGRNELFHSTAINKFHENQTFVDQTPILKRSRRSRTRSSTELSSYDNSEGENDYTSQEFPEIYPNSDHSTDDNSKRTRQEKNDDIDLPEQNYQDSSLKNTSPQNKLNLEKKDSMNKNKTKSVPNNRISSDLNSKMAKCTSILTPECRLEKLTEKLIHVKHLSSEAEYNTLHIDDITPEEDFFLIQCPREIDPKSFLEQELFLDKISSVSLTENGAPVSCDYYAIDHESDRVLNVLLPNDTLTNIQLGALPHAKNIILSKIIHKKNLTPFTPSKSSQQAAEISLSVEHSSSDSSNIFQPLHKGKKKKIKSAGTTSSFDDHDCTEPDIIKQKRKKKIGVEATDFSSDYSSHCDSKQRIDKIKKKRSPMSEISILSELNSIPSLKQSTLSPDKNVKSSDHLSVSDISTGYTSQNDTEGRKKKKIKRRLALSEDTILSELNNIPELKISRESEDISDPLPEYMSQSECSEVTVANDNKTSETTDSPTRKKKKKKKKKLKEYMSQSECSEVTVANDNKFSETTDSPTRKKKKKKKKKVKEYMSQSECSEVTVANDTKFSGTTDSPTRKKKKKKIKVKEAEQKSCEPRFSEPISDSEILEYPITQKSITQEYMSQSECSEVTVANDTKFSETTDSPTRKKKKKKKKKVKEIMSQSECSEVTVADDNKFSETTDSPTRKKKKKVKGIMSQSEFSEVTVADDNKFCETTDSPRRKKKKKVKETEQKSYELSEPISDSEILGYPITQKFITQDTKNS